jgi:hypothetical protein
MFNRSIPGPTETNPISYYFLHSLSAAAAAAAAAWPYSILFFFHPIRNRVVIVKAISIDYNSLCTGHYGVV